MMELKGTVVEIGVIEQVTDKFKKQVFVIEFAENPQYPELIQFELVQDKCGLIDDFQPNSEVTVYFNLKGRKWTNPSGIDKYFNTLQAWKISGNQAEEQAPEQEEAVDDLPF